MNLGISTRGRRDSAGHRGSAGAGARAGYCLAISLCVGISIYCALSALFGPAGLTAYRRLEERKAAMEANLVELGGRRESLSAELESLKSDADRAVREARSLGYLRKGETALILGERRERARPIDTGKVLPYAEPTALSDLSLKEISFGVCLALMALLLKPRDANSERARTQR
jgi:cell division protein FtsB